MKHGFRYLWRILVILLVNVLIIALAGNFGGSVQTLSKVGSTGEEVRQIQTKLKDTMLVSSDVKLIEPGGIARSFGKTKHVTDRRN